MMIKRFLTFAFICTSTLSFAQQVNTKSAEDITEKRYQASIDSVRKAFTNEPELTRKAQIFRDFYDTPKAKGKYANLYRSSMLAKLAELNAQANNVAASNAFIGEIKLEYQKNEAIRNSAAAYVNAGNKTLGVKMLRSYLDSLLALPGDLKGNDLTFFTYTIKDYAKLITPGSEKEIFPYLHALYLIGGEHFTSDISSRLQTPDMKPGLQLFYLYAKGLPATAQTGIAKVIGTAFLQGSVPVSMQADVLKDFSYVKNLDKYLKDFNVQAENNLKKDLSSLLTKPDINGKIWSIQDLKGKYVMLDFWGSWCLPCRFSHPHLKEVYQKYKDKGFEIIGVSQESSPQLEKATQAWKKAVAEDKIDWIQLLNNDGVDHFDAVKALSVGVFPTKILLNPQGKEIARFTAGKKESLDEKMKEVFGF